MWRMGSGVVTLCLLGLLQHCGGSTATSTTETRNITGTVSASTLTTSLSKGLGKAALSCTDVEVCCTGYTSSTPTVAAVDSNCEFTVALPLESFCFCGIFTGTDADSDGCGDTYVGSLGCAARGYGGALPIYAAADGSTSEIDLGTTTQQGQTFVTENDFCASVDTDDDGTADATDTDDDGDSIADDADAAASGGCYDADEFDSDDDNIPDIFQSVWSDLTDSDSDDVPDFCDITTDCDADEEDTDGDCIPDAEASCDDDDDADGFDDCFDCDSSDATVGLDCYEDIFCALDLDGDGVTLCDDCDDADDGDNRTISEGCEESCGSDSTECSDDFTCQLFADDRLASDPVCDGNSVSCMTCVDGCCTVTE